MRRYFCPENKQYYDVRTQVEVFKTNVTQKPNAEKIVEHLLAVFPDASVNFDLEDCDRILRVEMNTLPDAVQIMKLVHAAGFTCEVLND